MINYIIARCLGYFAKIAKFGLDQITERECNEYCAKMLEDEYEMKRKTLDDELDTKHETLYNEYMAKRKPIDDDYRKRLKAIDTILKRWPGENAELREKGGMERDALKEKIAEREEHA